MAGVGGFLTQSLPPRARKPRAVPTRDGPPPGPAPTCPRPPSRYRGGTLAATDGLSREALAKQGPHCAWTKQGRVLPCSFSGRGWQRGQGRPCVPISAATCRRSSCGWQPGRQEEAEDLTKTRGGVPVSLVMRLGDPSAAGRTPSGPRGQQDPASPPPPKAPSRPAGRGRDPPGKAPEAWGPSPREAHQACRWGGSDHHPAGRELRGLGAGSPAASVLRRPGPPVSLSCVHVLRLSSYRDSVCGIRVTRGPRCT